MREEMKSRIKEMEQLANKTQKEIDEVRDIKTDYKWELVPSVNGNIEAHWSYLIEGDHITIMVEPEDEEENSVKVFDPRRGGTVSMVLVGENFWDDFKTLNEAVEFSVREMVISSNASY